MKTLALLVLLASFSAPSFAKDKNVIVKTDRFTGKTTIVMKGFAVGPFFGFPDVTQLSTIGVSFSLGAIAGNSDDISLVVFVSAEHWQFLRGTDIHVLADGQPMDLGHFVATDGHVETIGAVTTNEAIIGHVDRVVLDRMANAKELEMEVGVYQVRMNSKNIQRLKDFSGALPSAISKAQTPAPVQNPKPAASGNAVRNSEPAPAIETPSPSRSMSASDPAPQTIHVVTSGDQPESLGDYARRMKADKAAK